MLSKRQVYLFGEYHNHRLDKFFKKNIARDNPAQKVRVILEGISIDVATGLSNRMGLEAREGLIYANIVIAIIEIKIMRASKSTDNLRSIYKETPEYLSALRLLSSELTNAQRFNDIRFNKAILEVKENLTQAELDFYTHYEKHFRALRELIYVEWDNKTYPKSCEQELNQQFDLAETLFFKLVIQFISILKETYPDIQHIPALNLEYMKPLFFDVTAEDDEKLTQFYKHVVIDLRNYIFAYNLSYIEQNAPELTVLIAIMGDNHIAGVEEICSSNIKHTDLRVYSRSEKLKLRHHHLLWQDPDDQSNRIVAPGKRCTLL